MKIAVVTWSARRVGGVEAYLAALPAALRARGHDAGLWHEIDGPADRPAITWDAGPTWSVATLGAEPALSGLQAWHPDVIYAHGLVDPVLERRVLATAPAALFAHSYYGTCVSGSKTFKTPVPRPCTRRFGLACLLHYYPHHCGGWNPLRMAQAYGRQAGRHATLSAYRVIATASEHMRQEYLKHGQADVRVIGLPVASAAPPATPAAAAHVRIVFAGRMEFLKGGSLLLEALPAVRTLLGRPVTLTMLGDGPARSQWEQLAAKLQARHAEIAVTFPGWVNDATRDAHYDAADVLAVPSVWPEPFGLVGMEAAARGLPAAAFAVGGIPEWLADGVNGHLAPADPPHANGLARALVRCVSDPRHHADLRRGAVAAAGAHRPAAHFDRLLALLHDVAT